MPLASITSLSPEAIHFQSFSSDGKIRSTFSLQWKYIERIDVFKRDLFSYDLICLQFYQSDKDNFIEIDEEDPYWQALLEGCRIQLTGFLAWESWFSDVTFPAFQTNLKTIYKRKDNTVEQGAAANP